MSTLWTVHVLAGSDRLAENPTSMEFCHTPRADEAQILYFRLRAGGWRRFDCRLVSLVNTGVRQEITVDILCESAPSVV